VHVNLVHGCAPYALLNWSLIQFSMSGCRYMMRPPMRAAFGPLFMCRQYRSVDTGVRKSSAASSMVMSWKLLVDWVDIVFSYELCSEGYELCFYDTDFTDGIELCQPVGLL